MQTDQPPIISRARLREVILLARTQYTWLERFAAGGQVFILWSNAMGRVYLHFSSASGEEVKDQVVADSRVEMQLWQAIVRRSAWLTQQQARVVGETGETTC